jgi:hypothetical protein
MAFVHSPKIVTDGLVLALDAGNVKSYPGSGTTWLDKSGRGNNGTLINGPTFNSGNGGSIVFDGVNDFVIVPTGSVNNITTQLSAFIWWKSTNITREQWCIGNSVYPTNSCGWHLEVFNSKLIFQVFPSLNFSFSTTTLQSNTIYYLGITYNSGNTTYYINGTSSGTQNHTFIQSTGPLTLGASSYTNPGQTYLLGGSVYGAQIYNRALTAQEVLQNYNATKGRFGL